MAREPDAPSGQRGLGRRIGWQGMILLAVVAALAIAHACDSCGTQPAESTDVAVSGGR
jgi:hypothetical protein